MKVYLVVGLAVNAIPSAFAICCPQSFDTDLPYFPGLPVCADRTPGTPCCATGRCNIFCCNCDGHCRTPSGVQLASYDERGSATEEVFAHADTAGDGNLTLGEYLEYMGVKEESQVWVDWFHEHDRNGDGVITKDEVQRV